jgi:methionyl-tRNA synthetase
MEIVSKFSGEAFRYYFMRECPFPGDGEFSWQRFADVYNSELANNLGNLYSRVVTLVSKNFGGVLENKRKVSQATVEWGSEAAWMDTPTRQRLIPEVQAHVERCEYNVAVQKIWQQILTPANQFAERRRRGSW